MKIFLLIIIFISNFAQAKEITGSQCVLSYLYPLKIHAEKKIGSDGSYDKLKHCSISCMLSIHCPIQDVTAVGIIKELADVLGPGNAEFADLNADYKGIEIYLTNKITKYDDCINPCEKAYPKNKCKLE